MARENSSDNTGEKLKFCIPIGLILGTMGFFGFFRVPARLISLHLDANERIWKAMTERRGVGFIEDQRELGDIVYGRDLRGLGRLLLGGRRLTGVENTCEVIAVYNALFALKRAGHSDMDISFPGLLCAFEKRGISLFGYFGTSFGSVVRYLKKSGLDAEVLKGRKINDQLLSDMQDQKRMPQDDAFRWNACIMMAENTRGKISDMVHTICITREEGLSGAWKSHNDFEGSKVYGSLSEAVFCYHNGKGRPLGLILL